MNRIKVMPELQLVKSAGSAIPAAIPIAGAVDAAAMGDDQDGALAQLAAVAAAAGGLAPPPPGVDAAVAPQAPIPPAAAAPQAPIIPPAPADPAAGIAFALNAVAAAAAAQIPARGGNAAIDVASLAKSLDWSHAYKVRKFNQFLAADPAFLEKWAASSRALNAAVEKNFETTPAAVVRLLRKTTVGHQILKSFEIPLDHALYNKDIARIADVAFSILFSSTGLSSAVQYPRLYSIKAMRAATNNVVRSLGGLKVRIGQGFEKARVTADLRKIILLMIYKYLADGNSMADLEFQTLLIKLSFDGALMGSRKFLAFCISSIIGLLARVQSPRNVHTIGLAFTEETALTIRNLIPDLTAQVMDIRENGIQVPTPFSDQPVVTIKVDFGVGLDYSSVTKGTEIGSVGANKFCFACNADKKTRCKVGDPSFDLEKEENWRVNEHGELLSMFGITSKNFHFCVLHGQSRQNDKMLVCTFSFAYMLRCAIQSALEAVEACIAGVKKAAAKVRAALRRRHIGLPAEESPSEEQADVVDQELPDASPPAAADLMARPSNVGGGRLKGERRCWRRRPLPPGGQHDKRRCRRNQSDVSRLQVRRRTAPGRLMTMMNARRELKPALLQKLRRKRVLQRRSEARFVQ